METGYLSLRGWLSSATQPAESASGESGLEGTFGPFSASNLPLLIVAAVLVVLVIVALIVVAAQLRRPSASRRADNSGEHLHTAGGGRARTAIAGAGTGGRPGSATGGSSAGGTATGGTATGGSLSQFRDALVQAETSLAQGGTSGDGIVHCWLALERGMERAGFRGNPGLTSTESTAEFLRRLHPSRGDVQNLLRLYNWASRGVTEDQRRISQTEIASAKAVLAGLRASIDAKLAAGIRV